VYLKNKQSFIAEPQQTKDVSSKVFITTSEWRKKD